MKTTSKIFAGGLLIAALAGTYLFGRATAPVETRTLNRYHYAPVEVIKEIEGPPEIVEKIVTRTETVEIPREVIREVFLPSKEEPKALPVEGYIAIEGTQVEGLNEAGDYERGWFGSATCFARVKDMDREWSKLIEEPFDITLTTVQSELRPSEFFSPSKEISVSAMFGWRASGGSVTYSRRIWQSGTGQKELWLGAGPFVFSDGNAGVEVEGKFRW